MGIKDALLPEYDHEMATTRRMLDRVPEADFAWKPHDKSMALGQLAGPSGEHSLLVQLDAERTSLDLATLGNDPGARMPVSRSALLKEFDEKVAAARALLANSTDPELLTPWTLKRGDHEIFTLPRISAIRSFVMNHMIHHRGQLSVYLRLRGVALPPIYGPTADEG